MGGMQGIVLGGEQKMKGELVEEMFSLIEARLDSRPTRMEFEMAYQARIAIDRIKFAIKHTEQFGPGTDTMREASLQLLDALQRLEGVDRRFQARTRVAFATENGRSTHPGEALDRDKTRSLNQANGRDRTQRRGTERAD